MNSLARDWELPRAGIPEAPPPDRPLGLRFRASPNYGNSPARETLTRFAAKLRENELVRKMMVSTFGAVQRLGISLPAAKARPRGFG